MERISRNRSGKTPLVLIHDGGGTTASYHALRHLDHDIYGIENPLLHCSKPWKGGIRAMARAYSALIELELGRTPVLLGGWSFGGLVALEMVEILHDEYSISVEGILLLDSVCPSSWKLLGAGQYAVSNVYASCLSSKLLVMNMMKHSVQMAEQWQAPKWPGMNSDSTKADCCCGEYMPSGVMPASSHRPGPPVVLVRCSSRLSPDDKAAARVDIARDCATLGWEHVRPGLISYTLSCSANHFNLFHKNCVDETTAKIREALKIMERHNEGLSDDSD